MITLRHPHIRSFAFDTQTRHLKLDPKDPSFFQDPYRAYVVLHAHGPYVFWQDYGFWCALGFDAVNGLLRDKSFGRVPTPYAPALRPELAAFDAVERYSLLELEPPEHTLLRKRINRAFVSRQIETLSPMIEAYAHQLADCIDTSKPFDLIKQFAMPLPVRVIAHMLGIAKEAEADLLAWSHAMVKVYTRTQTAEETQAANNAAAAFSIFLQQQMAEKRKRPKDDLLSLLVSEGAEMLSEPEVISTAILLLNAGHEATVHQTGNGVEHLLTLGAWHGQHLGDAARIAATLEELIRLKAPLHMFTRLAHKDVALEGGPTLKKGETIGLLLGAANRDPMGFRQADEFLPNRADQRNVTFGAGIHFCIGAPLARVEMAIALKVLFQRFPRLKLSGQAQRANSYHFYGLEQLWVELPQ